MFAIIEIQDQEAKCLQTFDHKPDANKQMSQLIKENEDLISKHRAYINEFVKNFKCPDTTQDWSNFIVKFFTTNGEKTGELLRRFFSIPTGAQVQLCASHISHNIFKEKLKLFLYSHNVKLEGYQPPEKKDLGQLFVVELPDE